VRKNPRQNPNLFIVYLQHRHLHGVAVWPWHLPLFTIIIILVLPHRLLAFQTNTCRRVYK